MMENNIEKPTGKDVELRVFPENKKFQDCNSETFFSIIQKKIDEVETKINEKEQFVALAQIESFGEKCGLSKEEVLKILEEKGFTFRLDNLRDKVVSSCEKFITQVRNVGAMATTALVLGMSAPAPSYAFDQEVDPTLSEQKITLPSYKDAIESMHKTVVRDKNERILVSIRDKDGVLKPIILAEGGETSIKCPQEVFDALDRGEDVEMTHTHPLSTYPTAGLMNQEEIQKVRNGEMLPVAMPPSLDGDFFGVIAIEGRIKKNTGKIYHKVVDSTGEWSYWIPDLGSENLALMKELKEVSSEIMKTLSERNMSNLLDPSEKEYLNSITENFEDPRMVFSALLSEKGLGSSTAKIILFKLGIEDKMLKYNKSLNKSERVAIDAVAEYLSLKISPNNTSEYNAQVVKSYEETAKKLGFNLKYIPNKKVE